MNPRGDVGSSEEYNVRGVKAAKAAHMGMANGSSQPSSEKEPCSLSS
jgi:hypothetical protein